MKACFHCGAEIPYSGDAFCPECRQPVDDPGAFDKPRRTAQDFPPQSSGEGQNPLHVLLGWFGFKNDLVHNKAAYVIIAISFGAAYCIASLVGNVDGRTLLLIGGPIATVLDVAYRMKSVQPHWFHPDQGGKFLFLPVWLFGVIWFVLGMVGTGPD